MQNSQDAFIETFVLLFLVLLFMTEYRCFDNIRTDLKRVSVKIKHIFQIFQNPVASLVNILVTHFLEHLFFNPRK